MDDLASQIANQVDIDTRLQRRLVQMLKGMARRPSGSLPKVCEGDEADIEGAYRFLRNDSVTAEQMLDATEKVSAGLAKQADETILAIQDTTALEYNHDSVGDELGPLGHSKNGMQGLLMHSTLLVGQQTETLYGVGACQLWSRDPDDHGKTKARRQRDYESKESYKWEGNDRKLAEHLDDKTMKQVISVGDREADCFGYLHHKVTSNQRFVVRLAQTSRCISSNQSMTQTVEEALEEVDIIDDMDLQVELPQRGGRKARDVQLSCKATRVELSPPTHNCPVDDAEPIEVGVIEVFETSPPEDVEPLHWYLITSESVDSPDEIEAVIGYYEQRWIIEQFHKVLKTGCRIEELQMQSRQTLEKMIILKICVGTRLFNLRAEAETKSPDGPCDRWLRPIEWKVLWLKTEDQDELPDKPPSIRWAYESIGKLEGWTDTKQTGRVGWETLWKGHQTLQTMVRGAELLNNVDTPTQDV